MLNKIVLLTLFYSIPLFSQGSFFFQPSIYFTYGDYSDRTNSQQYSVFSTFSWNNYDYLVLGYDRINIKNKTRNLRWEYYQNNFSGGIHYWLSELKMKLKLDLLKIDGNYKDDYISNNLVDDGYLISPEIVLGVYPFYYGAGFSYFKQTGNNNLNAKQIYLRTDYYPHYKFLINTILSTHLISDGRKQTSLQLSLLYFPFYELSIKGSVSIGSRSFFYNPDLMVFYNQLETQISNYSVQVNYNFYKNFVAAIQYQRANFNSYRINYFVFGIKTPFYF
ncbi:MAG: hypothetical protein NUV92_02970 [Ignavibacteria bacterium]|nr:hypothetical protein [Ignavibacteria bacterium]MDH7527192.1 hypothetical protein [Ignavibacteria bacterium]